MSLAEKLKSQKAKLQHTKTLVRTVEGKLWEEDLLLTDSRIREVEMAAGAGYGFVVDDKPDLQV